jgi:hypothetical protein
MQYGRLPDQDAVANQVKDVYSVAQSIDEVSEGRGRPRIDGGGQLTHLDSLQSGADSFQFAPGVDWREPAPRFVQIPRRPRKEWSWCSSVALGSMEMRTRSRSRDDARACSKARVTG